MVFWSDIEILQLIDACDKGERGGITSGINLAQALAADRGERLSEQDDRVAHPGVARLQSGGLLTWQVVSSIGRVRPITPRS